MSTAWKSLLSLFAELPAPAQQRGIRDPQIVGYVHKGLVTRLRQLYRFQLEFQRKGALHLGQGCVPFSGSPLLPVFLLHFLGSRP
jgi:hypothetical protein